MPLTGPSRSWVFMFWVMKKLKLKNADELQSYFTKRVSDLVKSKGKKPIGWDEILEGGLAPGTAVIKSYST